MQIACFEAMSNIYQIYIRSSLSTLICNIVSGLCFSCSQALETSECSVARNQPLSYPSARFPGYTQKYPNPALETAEIGGTLPGTQAMWIFQLLTSWLLTLSALSKENPSELELFL